MVPYAISLSQFGTHKMKILTELLSLLFAKLAAWSNLLHVFGMKACKLFSYTLCGGEHFQIGLFGL